MRIKYPKISLLILIIIAAYVIFRNPAVNAFFSNLGETGHMGAFIAGLFYSYGFTGPISAGVFLSLDPSINILKAGLLGGFGALIADIIIFLFIKSIFMEEFELLKEEKAITGISKFVNKITEKAKFVRHLIIYILASILLGSPLPDEAGIIILAGLTEIKPVPFILISFICNTAGILILLSL